MNESGHCSIEYEHARVIRSMVEHENNLVNHRITWLVTLQGLLFAALGFAWDKQEARKLVAVFCGMGILVAFSCWQDLRLSGRAYKDLLDWWDQHKAGYSGPPVIGYRTPTSFVLFLGPRRFLPWIFMGGWVLVLIHNWFRA